MIVSRQQRVRRCASCSQRRRRIIEAGGPFRFVMQTIDGVIHWAAGGGPLCDQ